MAGTISSATADPETPEQQLPKNAEDRKAAAALSSLNANEISHSGGDVGAKMSPALDQEALGKAMSRLEIVSGGIAAAKGSAGEKIGTQKEANNIKKKAVKVAAEDVALLVEELDLTKNKATELLKAHDGDVMKTIKSFILPLSAT